MAPDRRKRMSASGAASAATLVLAPSWLAADDRDVLAPVGPEIADRRAPEVAPGPERPHHLARALASMLPAWRAARLDPNAVLRQE